MFGRLFGGKRERITCQQCGGAKTVPCFHCGGSGMLSIPNRSEPCHHCNQTGKEVCPNCKGTGVVAK
jgi:glutaredoxin domain-containing cysteine-rich protein 1